MADLSLPHGAALNESYRATTGYNPADRRTVEITIRLRPGTNFHEATQAPALAKAAGELAHLLADRFRASDVQVDVEYVYPQWKRSYDLKEGG